MDWTVYDYPQVQRELVKSLPDGKREIALSLENIHCGACVRRCEQGLKQQIGVSSFEVNLSTRRARLVWDIQKTQLSRLLAKLSELGFPAQPYDAQRYEDNYNNERKQALKRLAVAGICMMQVMMFAVALYAGDYQDMSESLTTFLRWASLLVTLPVVGYAAQPFFRNAWQSLQQWQLNMDVPVALAIGAAFLASVWATFNGTGEVYFDSVVMFTFFLSLGRFLETSARHKAAAASEGLTQLLPAVATRVDGERFTRVAVAELKVGDTIVVKPGDPVPADSIVIDGISSVDESLLTGESLPRPRQQGDQVIGGSINIESPLTLRVAKIGADTLLATMAKLLERARLEKPRLACLADQVAAWFVGFILILAALVFAAWWWYFPEHAFWIMLSVLVVTCPCALSLATPTALTVATGTLTRVGLLPTRGHALESLAKIDHIIFDKTGTLTGGRLSLVAIKPLRNLTKEHCLKLAAALEQSSEHPIAQAIVKSADSNLPRVEAIKAIPGRGVAGIIEGQRYRLGSLAFATEQTTNANNLTKILPSNSMIQVMLSDEQGLIAVLQLRDELRPEAKSAIAQLKNLNIKLEILSGDDTSIVKQVADTLGIEYYTGNLSPQEKLEYLQQRQHEGKIIAMVGDGVNDVLGLARAQVSIAMASGTDIAHTSADMVLLSNRLDTLVQGIQLARKTLANIRQNLLWALLYNVCALPLAALGFIAPWMAAIGMSMSSLVVVLNALRLGRQKSTAAIENSHGTEEDTVAYSLSTHTT